MARCNRVWGFVCALGVGLAAASARADAVDDAIAALAGARAVHAHVLNREAATLTEAFDAAIRNAGAAGDLNAMRKLMSARQQFADDRSLPDLEALAEAAEAYRQASSAADGKLYAAYGRAIDACRAAGDTDQAAALDAEREKLGLAAPPAPEAATPTTPPAPAAGAADAAAVAAVPEAPAATRQDGKVELDLRAAGGRFEPSEAGDDPARYMVIPIKGTFGEDIVADGVERALTYARGMHIRHIVFEIDSPGGYVSTAEQIRESMKKHADAFAYHALIEDAISASIWVAFSCDTMHIRKGGSIGGAVVYHQDVTTGSAEVDAKMNSIITANLTALADEKGHVGLLVAPMVQQQATLYAWRSGQGRIAFSEERPADVAEKDLLLADSPETVLTLTHDQAVAIGLARPVDGGAEALGASLGLTGWTEASTYGAKYMEAAKARQAAKVEKIKERVTAFKTDWRGYEQMVGIAEEQDPANGHYFIDDSRVFTGESQREWTRRTDIALAAWKKALSKLGSLEREHDALKKLGMPYDVIAEDEFKSAREQIVTKMKLLAANRNKRGV